MYAEEAKCTEPEATNVTREASLTERSLSVSGRVTVLVPDAVPKQNAVPTSE